MNVTDENNQQVNHIIYGEGDEILFAFHGYGMTGRQFEVLDSLTSRYCIIGFHLPYHKGGPLAHEKWLDMVEASMIEILTMKGKDSFSIVGYSFGAKIALHMAQLFSNQLLSILLFAPYGIENHWGLKFLTHYSGNLFFKTIINTPLPWAIMRIITKFNVIDEAHFSIVIGEIDTEAKRRSLCNTLLMMGDVSIRAKHLVNRLKGKNVKILLVYGKHDPLFPFGKRNLKIIDRLANSEVMGLDEGHWMMTPAIDGLVEEKIKNM